MNVRIDVLRGSGVRYEVNAAGFLSEIEGVWNRAGRTTRGDGEPLGGTPESFGLLHSRVLASN